MADPLPLLCSMAGEVQHDFTSFHDIPLTLDQLDEPVVDFNTVEVDGVDGGDPFETAVLDAGVYSGPPRGAEHVVVNGNTSVGGKKVSNDLVDRQRSGER